MPCIAAEPPLSSWSARLKGFPVKTTDAEKPRRSLLPRLHLRRLRRYLRLQSPFPLLFLFHLFLRHHHLLGLHSLWSVVITRSRDPMPVVHRVPPRPYAASCGSRGFDGRAPSSSWRFTAGAISSFARKREREGGRKSRKRERERKRGEKMLRETPCVFFYPRCPPCFVYPLSFIRATTRGRSTRG